MRSRYLKTDRLAAIHYFSNIMLPFHPIPSHAVNALKPTAELMAHESQVAGAALLVLSLASGMQRSLRQFVSHV
jgi:hypothetical protein